MIRLVFRVLTIFLLCQAMLVQPASASGYQSLGDSDSRAPIAYIVLGAMVVGLAVTTGIYAKKYSDCPSVPPPPTPESWTACLSALSYMAVTPDQLYFNPTAFISFPQYNLASMLPAFVVVPLTTEDVALALRCAFENNIDISVKGGGHNYAGYSQATPEGFQINMQSMNSVQFIRRNGKPALKLGAGAVFETIYTFLNKSFPQYVMAGGLCPSVGATGFLLGGGLGPLSREYGIGCDSLLEVEMVTVNGSQIVRANETENPDLLWSLCGGGGPSFGVVTEVIVEIHPAFAKYSYGEFCEGMDPTNITKNLMTLASMTASSDFDDWLTVHWRLVKRKTEARGLCYLIYSLRGMNETLAALKNLTDSMGVSGLLKATAPLKEQEPPFWNFIEEFSYAYDMELANARYKGYEKFTTNPEIYTICMLPALNASLIQELVSVFEQMPDQLEGGPNCYVQGMVMGGRISQTADGERIPNNSTAFPWRDRIVYAADSMCSFLNATQQSQSEAFIALYFQSMKPWCMGGYLNFPQPGVPDYPNYYWRDNVKKLQSVRQTWNPYVKTPLSFPQEVPLP